ncbi:MAG: DUF3136 domain-containing protein [Cyanobacteriota bacterium]
MAHAEASQPQGVPGLSLVQLEAGYSTYCKALRMLILEGKSLQAIQRTLCWHRLELLHHSMPRQYRDPFMHYGMVKRSWEVERSDRRGNATAGPAV